MASMNPQVAPPIPIDGSQSQRYGEVFDRGYKHYDGSRLGRMHAIWALTLYSIKRAMYPRIEPEQWFLFQLVVQDRRCLVRINGDTVMEYEGLENLEAGRIELQAHDAGKWIEYKQVKIRSL